MKKHYYYFLLMIFLVQCKSESEKFDERVEHQIMSTLPKNHTLISFENIKNDSLSQRQIDNFIGNYAYEAMVYFHKEQEKIGSTIKNMDSAKTPEGIYKFQEDFKSKMKVVSDSFQYYSKIADKVMESKASEKKILKLSEYKLVIKNDKSDEIINKEITAITEGKKVFTNDAFFKYQVKKFAKEK